MATKRTQSVIVIENVIIDVGDGNKLEMTKDKAEQLRDLLVDLLGDKSAALDEIKKQLDRIQRDRIHDPIFIPYPQPYPVPVQPRPWQPFYYPRPYWEPVWTTDKIICGQTSTNWPSGNSTYTGTVQLTCKAKL